LGDNRRPFLFLRGKIKSRNYKIIFYKNMTTETKKFESFEDFTNLYEVQKTLRFELKPEPETDAFFKKIGIWYAKDEKRARERSIVKFYMDLLHREFTEESLKKVSLDFSKFFTLFKDLKKAENKGVQAVDQKKNKKGEIDRKKKEIADEFVNLRVIFVSQGFNAVNSEWKERYNADGNKIKNEKSDKYLILSENVLNLLKNRFTPQEVEKLKSIDKKHKNDYKSVINGEGKNIFNNFVGFFGYFDNLINNRKNFYESDGKSGRIATRSINENLNFFAGNVCIYENEFNKDLISKLIEKEKEIFQLPFYNKCLLQKGIEKYNFVVGDINKKINKYNQQNKKKIPFLKILYKQVLSMEEKEEYEHIEINNDDDLLSTIANFILLNQKKIKTGREIFKSFILRCQTDDNIDQIYLPKDSINTISNRTFKPWDEIMTLYGNKRYFISLKELRDFMLNERWKAMAQEKKLFKESVKDSSNVKKNVFLSFVAILKKEYQNQFDGFEKTTRQGKIKMIGYDKALLLLNEKIIWFKEKNGKLNDNEKMDWIKAIKDYSDAALRIFQMTKYFWLPITGDENDKDYRKIKAEIDDLPKDENFYNKVNEYIVGYEPFVYRSSFQEYLTKRPFSEDKFKINFDSSSLLKGWDKNKINERLGIILRDGDEYLLGIINKDNKHCFDDLSKFYAHGDDSYYELMQFKQLTGLYRQLPRMAFPKKKKAIIEVSQSVLKIKNEFDDFQKLKKEHKISSKEIFDNQKINILISYYRSFVKEYYKKENIYDFSLLDDGKTYERLSDFYADVDKITYNLSFIKVKKSEIKRNVCEGKLFLFSIYNKDFSGNSKGKNNLHTNYFNAVFNKENNPNGHLRLGANAGIYYRPASLKESDQKKEIIKTRSGKEINKKENPYHLKRYAQNKILFHLPVVLNADTYDEENVNQNVFKYIKNNFDNIKVIGIDRGEKNLAYYSVISRAADGKIKIEDCDDLNLGYLEPLNKLAEERQEQRRAWQSISKIKGKRDGYISHVIHKIVELILKHKAIVVFEDLSGGFKRSRMKIEKAPYQQLELALINKLNYLVRKKAKQEEAGHYLSAYQFAERIGSYKKVGKQTGIIFYTQAGYTSRTCPKCGWRKRIQGLYYKDRKSAQKIFTAERGVQISYDVANNYFVFKYHPVYNQKESKEWDKEVYSDVSRIKWDNKEKKYKKGYEGEITKKLKELFTGIDVQKNINIQIKDNDNASFWENLINLFRLILEIRNTDNKTGEDYIECPHCHFHSDKGFQGYKWNGDANGAYNIARKGLIILKKIKDAKEPEKLKFGDLVVNLDEWDKFVQKD